MRYAPLLIGLLGLAATRPGRAQHLQLGLKGGLLASTSTNVSGYAYAPRGGGVAGAWLRYPLGKGVSLQAELLVEQRGVKTTQDGRLGFEGSDGSYRRRERTRLHYGSLPLLVRGQVGQFYGLLGPHLSYLVAADRQARTEYVLRPGTSPETTSLRLPYPTTETDQSTGDLRRGEVGYTAGVGYQLGHRLAVEVRYAAGLTRVPEPFRYTPDLIGQRPLPYVSPHGRNRTWHAQLSYQLSALSPAK
jgi:hypothetical protein